METLAGAPSTISPWRPFPADPRDWYSAEEIEKSERYQRPVRLVNRIAAGLGFLVSLQADPRPVRH